MWTDIIIFNIPIEKDKSSMEEASPENDKLLNWVRGVLAKF